MYELKFSGFLVVILISVACAQQQCTRFYDLQPNRMINITSFNYPGALPSGSNCRFRLKAPSNHVIYLSCRFELVSNCEIHFFEYVNLNRVLNARNIKNISILVSVYKIPNVFENLFLVSSQTPVARSSCSSPGMVTSSFGMANATAEWVRSTGYRTSRPWPSPTIRALRRPSSDPDLTAKRWPVRRPATAAGPFRPALPTEWRRESTSFPRWWASATWPPTCPFSAAGVSSAIGSS